MLKAERINAGQTITVFELLTAVIFILFAENPADAAVIEVGLGGMYDATNVIAHPAVSLIMPIALDHQQWLGQTIEEIALAKAGIIKRGTPAVFGRQEEDAALGVLVDRAERIGAPYVIYGQDYLATRGKRPAAVSGRWRADGPASPGAAGTASIQQCGCRNSRREGGGISGDRRNRSARDEGRELAGRGCSGCGQAPSWRWRRMARKSGSTAGTIPMVAARWPRRWRPSRSVIPGRST